MKKNIDLGLLILRLSLGILMLLHGIAKFQNGVDGIVGLLQKNGLPGIIGYGVYLGEILAPILLLIGARTRIAALLYIATMLVAIFVAHPEDLSQFTQSGGWALELQGLYLFCALALFFTGGGKYAISSTSKWD